MKDELEKINNKKINLLKRRAEILENNFFLSMRYDLKKELRDIDLLLSELSREEANFIRCKKVLSNGFKYRL